MAVDNQEINRILALLWAGDAPEAKRLIVAETGRLESQISDLKDNLSTLESDLATLRSITPPEGDQLSLEGAGLGGGQNGKGAPGKIKLSQVQIRRRRREIIRAASEIAETSGEIYSDDVARKLQESGVVMGVPANRIGTAIGAVLSRHSDFEQISRGAYKKIASTTKAHDGETGPMHATDVLSE